MTDPRVAPVEDNLLSFMEALARQPRFELEPGDDVMAAYSDVAFPLFNPVSGARFAHAVAGERTRELVASYVGRGLPFLWWLTPSTTSPELEAVLADAGMARDNTPGMHTPLGAPVTPALPDGVELVEVVTSRQPHPFIDTMLEGFGMPRDLIAEFTTVLGSFDDRDLINVLATLDGRPVATGAAWVTGSTVGLYNITTLPEVRGRGLGYAVTARLMDLGRDRGCTEAVLHASEQGRPVYERLGFGYVCDVPQYVWAPSD